MQFGVFLPRLAEFTIIHALFFVKSRRLYPGSERYRSYSPKLRQLESLRSSRLCSRTGLVTTLPLPSLNLRLILRRKETCINLTTWEPTVRLKECSCPTP